MSGGSDDPILSKVSQRPKSSLAESSGGSKYSNRKMKYSDRLLHGKPHWMVVVHKIAVVPLFTEKIERGKPIVAATGMSLAGPVSLHFHELQRVKIGLKCLGV